MEAYKVILIIFKECPECGDAVACLAEPEEELSGCEDHTEVEQSAEDAAIAESIAEDHPEIAAIIEEERGRRGSTT